MGLQGAGRRQACGHAGSRGNVAPTRAGARSLALPGAAEPLSERLDRTLAHVVHVHAQNYAPQGGRQHPTQAQMQAPLARGIWDNAVRVERLRGSGYEGYIMVEFPYAEGDEREAALADDLAYLRSLTQS